MAKKDGTSIKFDKTGGHTRTVTKGGKVVEVTTVTYDRNDNLTKTVTRGGKVVEVSHHASGVVGIQATNVTGATVVITNKR